MLQSYAATLFNVLCSKVITTGGREPVYVHAQNVTKNKEMSKCTNGGGGLASWFPGRVARTLPEPKQKHRFFQRTRANWRAPVGKVEQLYKAMG